MAAEIRFLTDEQFRSAILKGVRKRLPSLDIVRVQDVGLRTLSDPEILEFAASKHRILLTHDVRTMETHARNRLSAGLTMPGVLIIRQQVSTAQAIEAITLVAQCSQPEEWNSLIQYLPL